MAQKETDAARAGKMDQSQREFQMLVAANIRDYFRESLAQAMRRSTIRVSETAQVYLVNLLSEFCRAEAAFAGTDAGEKPVMADLLLRAHDAEPQEAVRIYKHMGDSSLYLSGFFGESVEAAAVGVDYYVSIGEGAYANVAGLMRPTAASSSALFAELSDRFRALVDLLTVMSLADAGADNQKLLGVLQRYHRTGHPGLRDTLERAGVVVDGNDEN